jgi:O-antigen/teichoic acid export membrane protein
LNNRPRVLLRQTALNGLTQMAPQIATLAITPFVLHRIGIEAYGAWAVFASALMFAVTIDGGLSKSILRFLGDERADDPASRTGVLALGFLAAVVVGAIVTVLALSVGPVIAGGLDASAHGRDQVTSLLPWLGPLAALQIADGMVVAYLQWLGRWRAAASRALLAQAVFVAAALWTVTRGWGVRGLVIAQVLEVAAALAFSLLAARDAFARPRFIGRRLYRELVSYGLKVQALTVTGLLGTQADTLIVAGFLPLRDVAFYSLGFQAATAVRNVPVYALNPLFIRLNATFRASREAGIESYRRLQRTWLGFLIVYGAVGITCVPFGLRAWLGPGFGPAMQVGVILTVGGVITLLTGVITAALYADDHPGIGARYGVIALVANIAFTVPLAWGIGLLGVALGTALGQTVGTAWLLAASREPLSGTHLSALFSPGEVAMAAAGAVGCGLGELAIVTLVSSGVGALCLALVPPIGFLALAGLRYQRRILPQPATPVARTV